MMAQHGLILAAFIFSAGFFVAVTRKNSIMVLIGIELMLNAANLNLVIFGSNDPHLRGQMVAIFTVVVAAAEIAVALAILLNIYKYYQSSNIDELNDLGE